MISKRRQFARHERSAVILPTVLIVIALLSLIVASFVFFVNAEIAGTQAHVDGKQAYHAALSGFEEVTAMLREKKKRHDASYWYNDPEHFQHRLVWGKGFDRTSDPLTGMRSRSEWLADNNKPSPAWRYSVVAPTFDSDVDGVFRYGITPESAKLNLNAATDEQIQKLLEPLLTDLEIDNPQELIDALLDWRDEDDDVRDFGAESEYYAELETAYHPKNGRFDSVAELLMVKGFNAIILWGEDVNRNGLLDPNEDDGDVSFPPYDNEDGILNHGIAPFLTVWSREPDSALDNKPRINLYVGNSATVTAQMSQYLEDGELSSQTRSYLASVAGTDAVKQMKSPAELYGATGSPVQADEVPIIMDRFSVRSPDQNVTSAENLINVNAAPKRVLMTIPGMTEDAAAAIVSAQKGDMKNRTTPAWLVNEGIIDSATFRAIGPYITTKAYQFRVEILGYGDHVKLFRRYEWIIEMVGPLAQVRYYRDLTPLGMAWPIDEEMPEIIEQ